MKAVNINMEDETIVALYWQRDETALRETADRYGTYLWGIANRILSDKEDSDEIVNDTYLKAWHAIPPHRPHILSAFLAKITRQLAIDRYRKRTAAKRIPTEYTRSLEELSECVSGSPDVQTETEEKAVTYAIQNWLTNQSPTVRQVFLQRYFAMKPIAEIAAELGCGESRIKSMLSRARADLRQFLIKEELDT